VFWVATRNFLAAEQYLRTASMELAVDSSVARRGSGLRLTKDWLEVKKANTPGLALRHLLEHYGLASMRPAAVDRIHQAFGGNDTATFLDPLAKAEPHLQQTHPELAVQIAAIGHTTDRLRQGRTTGHHRRSREPDTAADDRRRVRLSELGTGTQRHHPHIRPWAKGREEEEWS
jgi:hypothetical protein